MIHDLVVQEERVAQCQQRTGTAHVLLDAPCSFILSTSGGEDTKSVRVPTIGLVGLEWVMVMVMAM